MRETFTDFYADLGIELKGRNPSEVTAEEIEAAYREKRDAYEKAKQAFHTQVKELHPDTVPGSEAAEGLSEEAIRRLKKGKEEELKLINEKWQQAKKAYRKVNEAFRALIDPEKRKQHDEAHSNRGAGNHYRTDADGRPNDNARNAGNFASRYEEKKTRGETRGGIIDRRA